MNFLRVHDQCLSVRSGLLKASFYSRIPHLGSCLSCVDILTYLYSTCIDTASSLTHDYTSCNFLLSKGHAAPALYQVLAEFDLIDKVTLKNELGKDGSIFHEHPPVPSLLPQIVAATGSLGHGFGISIGLALSHHISNSKCLITCLVGDGECNEGSIWESAQIASRLNLRNLVVFIDNNDWQATARSSSLCTTSLIRKFSSFGWHTLEINGHDLHAIHSSFLLAQESNLPTAILCNTIKGYPISFMSDNNNWHYKIPSESELEHALSELNP